MDILIPILIFIGIGGFLGFGLAFLSEKLKVERDSRIDDVLRYLPGANCGGCGCAGCDGLAEKIVKGEASATACSPCSPENKQNIAKVMGRSLENNRKMVAVVHCNGGNVCANKYAYQGYGDCQTAELIGGGAKACHVACLGLGSCVSTCTYNAVSIDKDTGVSVVNPQNCTSCGACVSACPKKVISRIPADAKIYVACSNTLKGKEVRAFCKNGCIACGRCEKECPVHAISISNNLAMIDYDKCTGCYKCVEVCPSHCVVRYSPKNRSDVTEKYS